MMTFVRHSLSSHFLPEIIERKTIFSLRKKIRLAGLLLSLLVFAPGAVFGQDVDLVLNVDWGPNPVPAGGVVTYKISVENDDGNVAATGVELKISVPAGMIYNGFDNTAGISCGGMAIGAPGPGTVTCTLPDIAIDAIVEFEAYLQSTVAGTFDVDFEVEGNENDPQLGNNSITRTSTVNAGADLSISMTGPLSEPSGTEVSYSITVDNLGPDASTTSQVQYTVPPGFVISSLPGGCSQAGSVVTCTIGAIANGGNHVISPIVGTLTAASVSTITHSASVSVTSGPSDPNSDNNTTTFDTEVTAGSDVFISKSRSVGGPYFVGDTFNFVLDPRYNGDVPIGLEIVDVVPVNYTITTGDFLQNGWDCTVVAQTVTCTRASGGIAGDNQSLGIIEIPVEVATAGTVTNTASISSASPFDPDLTNNSDTDGGATLQDPFADLSISKTGPSPALAVVGQEFDYVLTARNNGPEVFYGTLVVTDELPVGLSFESVTATGWTCTPAPPVAAGVDPIEIECTRVYTAGTPLAANTNAPTITLSVISTIEGSIQNSAEVSSPDANVGDPNPGNNTASYTVSSSVPPEAADLRMIKTITDPIAPHTVPAGEELTYRLQLVNDGPVTSTSVEMTDNFTSLINNSIGPNDGFVGFSIVTPGTPGLAPGDCSTASTGGSSRRLTCSIASFPTCTEDTDCPVIDVTVRPNRATTGDRTNTASIISNDIADPNLSNNTASITNTVEARADVTVEKIATPLTVPAGQNLTYVITASNNGPSRADAVTIVDTLPEDVLFVSATPSSGSCGTTPPVGQLTTAGNRTVECNLGNINNGAQQTVTIVVRPDYSLFLVGDPIDNLVSVSTSTVEPNPPGATNNEDNAIADLSAPVLDLLIANHIDTVDPVTINDVAPNNPTNYVITVTNSGPSDATNVIIVNDMPSGGLSYQSHTLPGGTCTTVPLVGDIGGRLICEVERINSGDSVVLTIVAQAEVKGVYENKVSVRSAETHSGVMDPDNPLDPGQETGYDVNYTNNSSNENTTVRTRVDLEFLSKVPSVNPVPVGENFNWVATLRNNVGAGLDEADDVVVTDNLPAGMELTGTPSVNVTVGTTTLSTCTGVAGDTSFTCNLGEVSNGAEIEFTIPVRVPEITTDPTVFNNTISVTTSSRDINTGNNSTTGPVTIQGANISGFVYRDFDDDGLLNNNDTGISGITMTLSGTAFNGLAVNKVTTTDGSGEFIFDGLPASDGTGYTVSRGIVSEAFLTVGQQTVIAPSVGNTGTVGQISAAVIAEETSNPGYLFGYIPQPRVGLAKRVIGSASIQPDASFIVDFRVRVENYSLEPLEGINITDQLNGAAPRFGTFVPGGGGATLSPNEYTIQTAPSFEGVCATGSVNAAFNGSGDQVLASGIALPIGGNCEINFSIRFEPPIPLPVGGYQNQASGNGTGEWTGDPVSDDSQDGANPDPDGDGDPTNNNTPTPVPIVPIADVTTTVTLTGAPNGNAGNTMSGTVLYRNAGPSAAENVVYTLTLSPNLTDLTFGNLPAGTTTSYNSGTGVVTFTGTPLPTQLAVNQIVSGNGTDPITFEYTQPGVATSTVTSTIATTTDQGANVLQDDDTETVTGIPIADVTTSVSFPALINSGQTVSGTVLFTNVGPSTAEGVSYGIQLRSGLELLGPVTFGNLPGGATASYDDATGVVTFTGMPALVTINQIVSGNGTSGITVSYVQPGPELPDPPFATTTPPSLSNVTSTISTTTQEPAVHQPNQADAIVAGEFIADVTTSLNDFPADADAGDPVSGRVIFRNIGPSVAEGVTYSVTLEPNLLALGTVEFSNLPPGASASYDNDTGLVTFTNMPGSLNPNQIAAGDATGILIEYTQPGPGESVVRSEIQTTTEEPAIHEPNTALVQVGGDPLADVETVISLSGSGNAGTTVTATVLYRNNGPSEAQGVTYELTLTNNLTNLEFSNLPSGASATYDPATGVVTFSSMPTELDPTEIASGNGTSGIIVTYTQPGDAFSEAESRIATTTDELTPPGITNNVSTDDISGILIADVTTSLDFPPVVDALTMVNGRVVYRNDGPSIASDVTYSLTLLPDLEDVSFGNLPPGATATYNPGTGIVTFTGMPPTLGIGEMASGDGTNGIEVNYRQPASGESEVDSEIGTSTDQGDNILPDTARVELEGRVADVTTEITISPRANAGETVTGTVLFENRGPSIASDVTYSLIFEPGLENLVISNLPAGATATYNPATGEITFTGMPTTLNPDQIASGDGVNPIGFTYTQPGTAISEVRSNIGTSTNQGENLAPDDAEAIVIGDLVADLAVTKISSASTAGYNTSIQYTIRVVNNGPSPVPSGSTLEDVPNGVELIGVSCSGADGNRCSAAPSVAALLDGTASLPSIPVNGFYEIVVTATVTAFQGTFQNSVTVNAPPNVEEPNLSNNTSSVSGTVESFPLIGIAKSASPLESVGGGVFRITFTINVENLGNEALTDVRITDPLSSAAGGDFGENSPSGPNSPGSYRVISVNATGLSSNQSFNGDTDLLLASGSLAVGASAVMTFVVEFISGQGTIVNQAKADGTGVNSGTPTEDLSHDGTSVNPSECGPLPQNCTDPTPILTPSIGITKQIADFTNLQNGRYDVTFNLRVVNLGVTPLTMIQISDDLTDFGNFTEELNPNPGEYTLVGSPEIISSESGASLTLKSAGVYNGESEVEMLVAELSALPNPIPNPSESVIQFTVRFFPIVEGPFLNLAIATASGPEGEQVRDESIDESNPDPNESDPTVVNVGPQMIGAAKEADEPVQSGLRSFLVTYRVIIANLSESVTATYVQLSDDLTQTFPTAQSITIEKPATILECTGTELELADPMFDGVEQIQFLRGDQHLQPGEQCTIEFSVEVDYGEGDVPTEPKLNQAIATTHGSPGGDVIAIGRSDDGDIPAPDGEKTPVVFEPADPTLDGGLIVVKTSSLLNVTVGQMVPFTIQVTNPNPFRFENVELRDLLPPGFQYRTGTATVDGLAVEPTIDGRSLSWAGLVIAPEQTVTIRLILVVGAGVQPGEYTNIAQAFDDRTPPGDEDRPLSEVGSASVRVVPDPIFDCADIIGKVFLDNNRNNRQTTGENGLANVRIATARGWLVTTDADGKFSIACAAYPDPQRGSNFILKLDESSLPEGYTVVSENPRTVRVTAGKVTEANFGVAAPANLRIEISANAFAAGSRDLLPDWKSHLEQLEDELPDRPILLQIIYRNHGEAQELPRERVESIMRFINENWSRSSLNRIVSMEEVIQNHE